MVWAAVRSKAMILSLVVAHILGADFACDPGFVVRFFVFIWYGDHHAEEERTGCFALAVFFLIFGV